MDLTDCLSPSLSPLTAISTKQEPLVAASQRDSEKGCIPSLLQTRRDLHFSHRDLAGDLSNQNGFPDQETKKCYEKQTKHRKNGTSKF